MAEVLRVNGGVGPSEQVGRNVEWIQVSGVDMTAYTDNSVEYWNGEKGKYLIDSDLEKTRRAIDSVSSITFIGEPSATDVVFGVEGVGATTVEIAALINAAIAGTVTVSIVSITGAAFA